MDVINADSGDQETDQVVRDIVAKWDYQRKKLFRIDGKFVKY
ncbi:hypothetical protein [Pediococcus pentosaceus]|nr:hypothetical protein [Pediococcus pentosaceus]MDN3207823.1 hypothetical protein [Pediococcus pentosaceus]